MDQAKEILKLNGQGFSLRDIAASVGCGKSVVGETIKRATVVGIHYAETLTEEELEKALFPEKSVYRRSADEPDMARVLTELSRKHVTRQLLWEEYKAEHPNGLMYTQFCERIRDARKAEEINYHKIHKAGEECEVDWAGTEIAYWDKISDGWREAFLFVAVLPASMYAYAHAYPNRKTDNWINAHINAFIYFGGTSRILIPDCTKTAVTGVDLFDPVLTKTYQDMAAHYDITIVPARSYHARDKNCVENSVGNVSRRIIAALRDERFTSVNEINAAVAEKLEAFNTRPFKKLPGCRRTAYEQTDKPMLRPLPQAQYETASFKICKIGINYHVEFEKFFYSTPYPYRGLECTIRGTRSIVEVYVRGELICAHIRHYEGDRYVTDPGHLPENHKAVSEWNDERFIEQAKGYGDKTEEFITALLASTQYPVHAYRACMGVFRQAAGLAPEIVEAASVIAIENRYLSSKYFGLAVKQAAFASKNPVSVRVVEHSNIRGAASFARGGIRNA
jgi:transposase